jgi:hypothetical protein
MHFRIVMVGSVIIFFSLEKVNDSMAGKNIKAIVKLNGKVFLATNAGIYWHSYSNFYQYK